APVNTGDLQGIYRESGFSLFRFGGSQNGSCQRAGAGAFGGLGPLAAGGPRASRSSASEPSIRRPNANARLALPASGALLSVEFLPPARNGGQSSHKSETRISAIADFARKDKPEKKALPLSPRSTAHGARLRVGDAIILALAECMARKLGVR